ncbi:hypothetical protein GF406_22760 [candidate division KSB1 bacterium]|nr:hypothetical protein [candidate division KSB1 bacterium]
MDVACPQERSLYKGMIQTVLPSRVTAGLSQFLLRIEITGQDAPYERLHQGRVPGASWLMALGLFMTNPGSRISNPVEVAFREGIRASIPPYP